MSDYAFAKAAVITGFMLAVTQVTAEDIVPDHRKAHESGEVRATQALGPASKLASPGEPPGFGVHLNGAWATPGVEGAGIMLEVMPDTGLLFFAWFTFPDPFYLPFLYRVAGETVPGYSDQRWLTAYGALPESGGTRVELVYENTTGGGFDTDPSQSEWTSYVARTSDYGTGWLELLSCDRISVHYEIASGLLVGTTEMVRLSPDGRAKCADLVNTALRGASR